MKTAYYVANVVNAYRRAIDLLNQDKYPISEELKNEVFKSSHRKYSTGFYFGGEKNIEIETSTPVTNADFIAQVIGQSVNNVALIEQRNRFPRDTKLGDING